jgi:hypothetical protein
VDVITLVGILLFLVVSGAIFFVIARRILRIAMKLAFVMAVVVALVITAGFGWWRGWFETGTKNHIPAPTTNKRGAPANRAPR